MMGRVNLSECSFRRSSFCYVPWSNEMNVVMPRSNFDLRDLEAPPRWDAITETDAGLQDQSRDASRLVVEQDSFWGRSLTVLFWIVLASFLTFAVGWQLLR